jgi:hypothetical protein
VTHIRARAKQRAAAFHSGSDRVGKASACRYGLGIEYGPYPLCRTRVPQAEANDNEAIQE